ncbi:MAG: hypothetical protein PHF84_11250, partial [bacterium]|nr:hypothetical protein [bacterium]
MRQLFILFFILMIGLNGTDGSGQNQFDQIMKTDSKEAEKAKREQGSDVTPLAVHKVLDAFEYEDPSEEYKVDLYDRSDLKIYSTRDAFEGSYSLMLKYKLESDNLWGSRVMIRKEFSEQFAINDFVKGSVMVKGDGSQNVFRILLRDSDGEMYVYQSETVLQNGNWQELVFSRSDFIRDSKSVMKDGRLGKEIKAVGFELANPFSENRSGTVYIDHFQLFYSMEGFTRRKKEPQTSLKSSERIFKNSSLDVEYRKIDRYREAALDSRSSPFLKGDLFWMWFYLNTEYRYKNFLVQGLIGFKGHDFSEANERWGQYELFGQDLHLTIDTSTIIKYMDSVKIGQITPVFNRFLFYNLDQYWWEGVEMTGKFFPHIGYDKTGYNMFLIKEWDDSYSLGFKTWYTVWGINATFSGVMYRGNALYKKNEHTFQSRNVMKDDSFLVELVKGLNLDTKGGFSVIWLTYGQHNYRRDGQVYVKDSDGIYT